ncbi:MAG: hypothetical protein WHS43_07435 [Aquificaceae bacterium]|jgi:hypothetical protein|uniref:hypothetical protein n=1 Tax=Hydrogenobacter sp. Uz 6-8 TaxID=3384828 RepID=UPI0030A7B776
MIKINLARVRKERPEKAVAVDIAAIRRLRLRDLFKAGGEYYAGIVLWIGVVAVLGYYWKVNQDVDALKAELNRLNAEKVKLQTEAKRFLDEKKAVEERIARIKKEIQDIERSKDIILGLKSYYEPFNSGFLFYTSYVPKASWVSSYRQNLDLDRQMLVTELEVNSLDYNSLSNYGKTLGTGSQRVMLTQLERKLNPHGFEYYSIKLNTERELQEGR